MFKVEFYEDRKGRSELIEYLEYLRIKSVSNKNARIQFRQMSLYIQLLQDHGTKLPINIAKNITENIWELRPGDNRILYFFNKDDTFILLHYFRKKTQKRLLEKLERLN